MKAKDAKKGDDSAPKRKATREDTADSSRKEPRTNNGTKSERAGAKKEKTEKDNKNDDKKNQDAEVENKEAWL